MCISWCILHLKLCRDRWSDRTGIFSIVCCSRRGTMWLHILRGMKAEVIMHCSHMHSWGIWEVWYLYIFIDASIWNNIVIKDDVRYILVVAWYKEVCYVNNQLSNWTCDFKQLVKQIACWDVSSHPWITECMYLMHVEGVGSSGTSTVTPK
jgi:hypothetical protein